MTLLQKFSLICLVAFCVFGLSLGFIITNSLEQHGGYIRLDSEEGRGTTVLIGLPLR